MSTFEILSPDLEEGFGPGLPATLYGDNGKENGNYLGSLRLYRDFIGFILG